MATLAKAINKNFLDSILPVYGNPRENVPTWDNSQKMFICNEHESTNGNRYYCGIRFCERIVIVEKVGLYHNWTYIDGIELYAFNGKGWRLYRSVITTRCSVKRISSGTNRRRWFTTI